MILSLWMGFAWGDCQSFSTKDDIGKLIRMEGLHKEASVFQLQGRGTQR